MKSKNKQQRLNDRIKDFSATMNERSKEAVVQHRKETGGFHKPGSNNK